MDKKKFPHDLENGENLGDENEDILESENGETSPEDETDPIDLAAEKLLMSEDSEETMVFDMLADDTIGDDEIIDISTLLVEPPGEQEDEQEAPGQPPYPGDEPEESFQAGGEPDDVLDDDDEPVTAELVDGSENGQFEEIIELDEVAEDFIADEDDIVELDSSEILSDDDGIIDLENAGYDEIIADTPDEEESREDDTLPLDAVADEESVEAVPTDLSGGMKEPESDYIDLADEKMIDTDIYNIGEEAEAPFEADAVPESDFVNLSETEDAFAETADDETVEIEADIEDDEIIETDDSMADVAADDSGIDLAAAYADQEDAGAEYGTDIGRDEPDLVDVDIISDETGIEEDGFAGAMLEPSMEDAVLETDGTDDDTGDKVVSDVFEGGEDTIELDQEETIPGMGEMFDEADEAIPGVEDDAEVLLTGEATAGQDEITDVIGMGSGFEAPDVELTDEEAIPEDSTEDIVGLDEISEEEEPAGGLIEAGAVEEDEHPDIIGMEPGSERDGDDMDGVFPEPEEESEELFEELLPDEDQYAAGDVTGMAFGAEAEPDLDMAGEDIAPEYSTEDIIGIDGIDQEDTPGAPGEGDAGEEDEPPDIMGIEPGFDEDMDDASVAFQIPEEASEEPSPGEATDGQYGITDVIGMAPDSEAAEEEGLPVEETALEDETEDLIGIDDVSGEDAELLSAYADAAEGLADISDEAAETLESGFQPEDDAYGQEIQDEDLIDIAVSGIDDAGGDEMEDDIDQSYIEDMLPPDMKDDTDQDEDLRESDDTGEDIVIDTSLLDDGDSGLSAADGEEDLTGQESGDDLIGVDDMNFPEYDDSDYDDSEDIEDIDGFAADMEDHAPEDSLRTAESKQAEFDDEDFISLAASALSSFQKPEPEKADDDIPGDEELIGMAAEAMLKDEGDASDEISDDSIDLDIIGEERRFDDEDYIDIAASALMQSDTAEHEDLEDGRDESQEIVTRDEPGSFEEKIPFGGIDEAVIPSVSAGIPEVESLMPSPDADEAGSGDESPIEMDHLDELEEAGMFDDGPAGLSGDMREEDDSPGLAEEIEDESGYIPDEDMAEDLAFGLEDPAGEEQSGASPEDLTGEQALYTAEEITETRFTALDEEIGPEPETEPEPIQDMEEEKELLSLLDMDLEQEKDIPDDLLDMPSESEDMDSYMEDELSVSDETVSAESESFADVIPPEQIEEVLERVIEKMFAKKIENILSDVVEKAVAREMEKLKDVFIAEPDGE